MQSPPLVQKLRCYPVAPFAPPFVGFYMFFNKILNWDLKKKIECLILGLRE
jgi:hypothetical protein